MYVRKLIIEGIWKSTVMQMVEMLLFSVLNVEIQPVNWH